MVDKGMLLKELNELKKKASDNHMSLVENDVDVYIDAFDKVISDGDYVGIVEHDKEKSMVENLCRGLVAYLRIFCADKLPCNTLIDTVQSYCNSL